MRYRLSEFSDDTEHPHKQKSIVVVVYAAMRVYKRIYHYNYCICTYILYKYNYEKTMYIS